MNERIKELAGQASHQSPDGYPVTIPYSKDFAEKFAELIVQECIGVVEDSEGYSQYFPHVTENIEKHFGVEL